MSFILLGILNSQVSGAAGGAAYDLLETQVLSTTAASITFTGLGSYSDYKHLQIRMTTRNDRSAGNITAMRMRFNSVSTNSYSRHILSGYGGGVFSGGSSSQTQLEYGDSPTTATGSGIFSANVIDILDFSSTNKNTTIRALGGKHPDITNQNTVDLVSGAYYSTDAITSITLSLSSNNFVSGSRFSLYGIRG